MINMSYVIRMMNKDSLRRGSVKHGMTQMSHTMFHFKINVVSLSRLKSWIWCAMVN